MADFGSSANFYQKKDKENSFRKIMEIWKA